MPRTCGPIRGGRRGAARARSAPDAEHIVDPQNYHERVVRFLRRSDFNDILHARIPTLVNDARLNRKLELIKRIGVSALLRFTNDVHIISVLRCVK